MRHKGFTLVELMIVLVVAGILAAMMMFSSTESVDMARATKIINDLQMLKRAALSYYADNYDAFRTKFNKTIDEDAVMKYVSNKNDPDLQKTSGKHRNYGFAVFKHDPTSSTTWFVYYRGDLLEHSPGVRRRLEGRAKSHKLWRNDGEVLHFGQKGDNWTSQYDFNDPAVFEKYIYIADAGENSYRVGLQIR